MSDEPIEVTQAVELLAQSFERSGKLEIAVDVRRGKSPGHCTPLWMDEALSAIETALRNNSGAAMREAAAALAEEIGRKENGYTYEGYASTIAKRIRALPLPSPIAAVDGDTPSDEILLALAESYEAAGECEGPGFWTKTGCMKAAWRDVFNPLKLPENGWKPAAPATAQEASS